MTTVSEAPASSSAPLPTPLFGSLSANPKGFAFVRLDDGGPDVFIPPKARLGAQHGERVGIVLDDPTPGSANPDRRSGRVVQVPDRAPEWIGEVVQGPTGLQLRPVDPRLSVVDLSSAPPDALGAIVRAQLTSRPKGPNTGQAQWLSTLGVSPTAPVVNVICARAHDLPGEFSPEVLAAAEAFAPVVNYTPQAYLDRTDLRHLPFCTIDGTTSKDLDDALWAEILPDGIARLLVAIADVSYYVRPGSVIDLEAQKRTTSVYLPGTVIPMLPNALSQGLCSLNPDVERLCVVCEMHIAPTGEVLESQFYRAVMKNHARLSYAQVHEHLFQDPASDLGLENPSTPTSSLPKGWVPAQASLAALKTVYERLASQRAARGAMDFSSNEVALALNASGTVRGIYKPQRTHAHRLVEETMVAANVQAAKTLHEREQESLFRAHGAPPVKKHDLLHAMLQARNLPGLAAHGTVSAGELASITQDHPHLSSAVLRAQDKARYETRNLGHFGLGLEHYAHFTSPIRRYPDLVMHRVLTGQDQPDLDLLAAVCSEGERRATAAEREAVDRLRAAYLTGKEGERLLGTIESITRIGAFVSLDDTAGSGLLPLACFGDNAVLDEIAQHITDEQGHQWGLGQAVEVALAASDWRTNRIEFAAPSIPMLAPAPTVHASPRP